MCVLYEYSSNSIQQSVVCKMKLIFLSFVYFFFDTTNCWKVYSTNLHIVGERVALIRYT